MDSLYAKNIERVKPSPFVKLQQTVIYSLSPTGLRCYMSLRSFLTSGTRLFGVTQEQAAERAGLRVRQFRNGLEECIDHGFVNTRRTSSALVYSFPSVDGTGFAAIPLSEALRGLESLSGRELQVWAYLWLRADQSGVVWAGSKRVGESLGMEPRNVRRSLSELVSRNLIDKCSDDCSEHVHYHLGAEEGSAIYDAENASYVADHPPVAGASHSADPIYKKTQKEIRDKKTQENPRRGRGGEPTVVGGEDLFPSKETLPPPTKRKKVDRPRMNRSALNPVVNRYRVGLWRLDNRIPFTQQEELILRSFFTRRIKDNNWTHQDCMNCVDSWFALDNKILLDKITKNSKHVLVFQSWVSHNGVRILHARDVESSRTSTDDEVAEFFRRRREE